MYLLRIPFSTPDIVILVILAIVSGFVAFFVISSRRKLQAMIEESRKQTSLTDTGNRFFDEPLKPKWMEKKKLFPVDVTAPFAFARSYKETALETAPSGEALHDLKRTMQQQQKTIDHLLSRIDRLDSGDGRNRTQVAATTALEEKEAELQKTKQQLSASQKIAGRVTEVYEELDLLQQKLAEVEERAGRADALALELDDMHQAYEHLKTEATRNAEKLQELMEEVEHTHQQVAALEEELLAANTQRQQLQKRVQLLENMNAELQHMTEANQKMKAELRRIAELESMLSLVSDERDLLLKKRLS
jgi:chromosome segregation ATPase